MTESVDLIETTDEEVLGPTELESLIERAELLGLKYDKRWGVEKMRELVNTAVNAEANQLPDLKAAAETAVTTNTEISAELLAQAVAAQPEVPKVETLSEKRYRLRQEANKLVRVHIMNMNPARKEWESDTYTVGNAYIGTITRVVPFNVDWHIEQALLNVLQERECTVFKQKKNPNTGAMETKMHKIKELHIAILPPLTETELKKLAQRQAMAAGTEEDED